MGMMFFTPSAKSQVAAGIGLSAIAWGAIFHIDYLTKLLHIQRWLGKERLLRWVNAHKFPALLLTEAINFGIHGVSSASGVTFALGASILNSIMIFAIVPIRQLRFKDQRRNDYVEGVAL